MNNNTDVVLEAIDLRCRYGSQDVLRGVQLSVRRGEVYAVLGGNGAGKSTLLHAFLGFVKPTRGSVRVAGCDVQSELHQARARLAYVPENVALYEQLTARENLRYLLGLSAATAAPHEIDAALDAVGLDAAARDRRLATYSKGMRQRVALALAVARHAPALLLDEPSSGLDPRAISDLNSLIGRLREQGIAVLMTTHDLLTASEIADRVGFLTDGVLTEEPGAGGSARLDVRALHERFTATVARR
jgi:ABC-2 type transport system ATP-binding protein